MSEIVIKGMEMPKDCEECQIATVTNFITWCPLKKCNIKKGYSFRDCPLVELPPHGRLVDADALKIDDSWSLTDTGRIWNAPTILEASK